MIVKITSYQIAVDPRYRVENRSGYAAQRWIERHLPASEAILLVGQYALNLPRLIAADEQSQAIWGEYFMYRRYQNRPWRENFEQAHQWIRDRHRAVFRIYNLRRPYYHPTSPAGGRVFVPSGLLPPSLQNRGNTFSKTEIDRILSSALGQIAHKDNIRYIVTTSAGRYSGSWAHIPDVKLLHRFAPDQGYRG